ncbi:MAG TPA: TonB-dependent receptor [Bryobacteraceae bacterium]|nr:TonB-dependent receptor [Bryobacteraceae bacterium]
MIRVLLGAIALSGVWAAYAGPQGSVSSVTGTVTDPSGAVIANATVQLQNKVTGFDKSAVTDASGSFRFLNLTPDSYHVGVTAQGFQPTKQDIIVRASVPSNVTIKLSLAEEATSINVAEDADLVESIPTPHTVVDQGQFEKLPNNSIGSGLNTIVAHSAPGIVEDSNGFIHPQGDHAQTQFVFDNQPVTDQQSKQFSTSMPENAIASVEVIAGAPPAEYGDKTSLVVNAVTKSGLGVSRQFGSLALYYGSFGTAGENFTEGFGSKKFGYFIAANTVRSGRYLDPPEFSAIHDAGNNQTVFQRLDYQPTDADTLHLNLFFSRAWFQTPNTYDQSAAGQDQRQRILSYNIAPGWVHLINANSTVTVNPYFRQDQVVYTPSRDPFADQPATLAQGRRLTNVGIKSDYSWVNHNNSVKIGAQVQHTFLTERFSLGITDPNYVVDNNAPGLAPYDLTNGGVPFQFNDHADIKEYSFYIQDSITFHGLTAQVGLRADWYRGLVAASSLQPRIGLSYLFKPTNTVLRLSYSKFFETPYNENLLLSSVTGEGGLAANTIGAFGAQPLHPGTRDQYNVGVQQGIGKRVVVDTGYFWKYTHNAFDFDTLFNTPIAFPIEWRKSKIDGVSARVTMTDTHGFTAYFILGHTRARFFGPEIGGLLFNSPLDTSVFRIDHDQALETTANIRYQPKKNGLWVSFSWRYDSGAVAGAVPDLQSVYALSGDEQAAIGFHCGSTYAAVGFPITSCPGGNATATRVVIPAPGTYNADLNPPRIAPRNLFDAAIGHDNIFHTDRIRYRAQITAVNLTNEVALYNFLSTFSGTHFVSPRGITAEIGMIW